MSEPMYLENEYLRITVYPERGAKIGSIIFKPLDREILYREPGHESARLPVYGQTFGAADSWGFDDMFPTISRQEHDGKSMPDHGELWSLPWSCSFEDSSITAEVSSSVFSYRFERRMCLKGRSLCLDYTVENLGEEDLPSIWAAHMLLAIEAGMQLEVPSGMDKTIDAFGERLGRIEDFPGADRREIIPERNAAGMQKYYFAYPVSEGICSLKGSDYRVTLRWDQERIPYLGIWVNEGGWGDQYTVGIEPATGGMDSPSQAAAFDQSWVLRAGKKVSWSLEVSIDQC